MRLGSDAHRLRSALAAESIATLSLPHEDGIRLDLEWLHRVGVRGVQVFDGGMGTPLVVPERVSHGSPQWRDAVRLAVDNGWLLS